METEKTDWFGLILLWLLVTVGFLVGILIKDIGEETPPPEPQPAEYDTVRAVYLGEFYWQDKEGSLYFVEETTDEPLSREEREERREKKQGE